MSELQAVQHASIFRKIKLNCNQIPFSNTTQTEGWSTSAAFWQHCKDAGEQFDDDAIYYQNEQYPSVDEEEQALAAEAQFDVDAYNEAYATYLDARRRF